MTVVNNEKDRVRTRLKNDVKSNRTNIGQIWSDAESLSRVLDNIMQGASQQNALDFCKESCAGLSGALNELERCSNYIDQIVVTEEIEDEQHIGYYW